MTCRTCKYWLRDKSFPENVGFCSVKNAVVDGLYSCELFKREDDESVVIKVLSYCLLAYIHQELYNPQPPQ